MLEVSNLSFSYTDKKALHSISFSVQKGDFFAVLGPNAAGKTTLLKILTGQLDIQEGGKVVINGDTVGPVVSTKIKKQLGIMHQLSGTYLKMTGFEYLTLVAVLYDYPQHLIKSRVSELAAKYNFEEELHRIIKKYSAGTKKKIEFCSAIIHEPQIIFLDEPFESVDPVICYEIKSSLKGLVKTGVTVVIASHILESIQNVCNRYIIINKGRVISQGTIDKENQRNLEKIFVEAVKDEDVS